MILEEKIQNLLEPTISSMGFEFWGCEYLAAGKHSTLRVYIDKPEGITVDDCGKVSHQVSAIMDVEDPISSAYMLEVSSPGVDRPLFKPEHFQMQKGRKIKVKSSIPVMGRKNFKGSLVAVNDDGIEIEVDNEIYEIAFVLIDKANLEVEF